MKKIVSNKCLRCGKPIKGSTSNSGQDNCDRWDNGPDNIVVPCMPCTVDGQDRAIEAWKRINASKKKKIYCFKCSIIMSVKNPFNK